MLCCALHSVFRDKQQESMMILVGAASDIPVGRNRTCAGLGDSSSNVDGEFHAIDDTCTIEDVFTV